MEESKQRKIQKNQKRKSEEFRRIKRKRVEDLEESKKEKDLEESKKRGVKDLNHFCIRDLKIK